MSIIRKKSVSGAGLWFAASLLASFPAVAAPALLPPFDASYQIFTVSESGVDTPIPGVPPPYAGLTFEAGRPNRLLLVGHAYSSDINGSPSIYSIGVSRNGAGHINGFIDNATLVAPAPGFTNPANGAGAGLGFGPKSVLFYASNVDSSLGQIESGSSAVDKQVDLAALTPTAIVQGGPLAFVPEGFPGAGKLKMGAHDGRFYSLSLAADGSGTYDVSAVVDIGKLAGSGTNASGDYNVPTGFGYVAAGNPEFAAAALLASQCDFNEGDSVLYAYDINSKGDIKPGTARGVASNLCAAGATIDPVTGDMLFTTYYGYPSLIAVRGFTVAPPAVAFSSSQFSVNETKSKARIVVRRLGSSASAVTVKYRSVPGSANAGVNYTDVSGTLSWAAAETADKSFDVPIKTDGLYNSKLTVQLKLSDAKGAALGAPATATLSIVNKDPPPAVSLTSVDHSVGEASSTLTLNVALNTISGLPVTVPFVFSGSAVAGQDYGFDVDLNGDEIQSVVVPPNSSSGTLTIHLLNDTLDEDDETLIATMGTPTNASLGAVTVNTITLLDDDAPPQIEFSSANSTITEGSLGAGVAVPAVKLKLSAASGKAVSVPVTIANGGSDARVTLTSPVSIAPGQTEAYAASVADDAAPQSTTSLKFKLGAPGNASKGAQSTTTLKIKDNDP